MAGAALTPRVQMLAICDNIQPSKREDAVFHLKGVRQHVTAASFPHMPRRLWLFCVLCHHRGGQFPCYIRVINDLTDRTIFYSYLDPAPTFDAGVEYWMTGAPMRCSFPEPGRYTVELCFFQARGPDVIKGETHLWVSHDVD